jgi:hypothetical protein
MLSMALTGPSDSPPFCSVEIHVGRRRRWTYLQLVLVKHSWHSGCHSPHASELQPVPGLPATASSPAPYVTARACIPCVTVTPICNCYGTFDGKRLWSPAPSDCLSPLQISRHRCSTQLFWFLIFFSPLFSASGDAS